MKQCELYSKNLHLDEGLVLWLASKGNCITSFNNPSKLLIVGRSMVHSEVDRTDPTTCRQTPSMQNWQKPLLSKQYLDSISNAYLLNADGQRDANTQTRDYPPFLPYLLNLHSTALLLPT